MSSRDFDFLTLRNLTAYNADGSFVKQGYVLTASTFGKGVWTNSLALSSISSGSGNFSTLVVSSLFPSTIYDNLGSCGGANQILTAGPSGCGLKWITGGGGGGVTSVVGGTNIYIDNTTPSAPIVNFTPNGDVYMNNSTIYDAKAVWIRETGSNQPEIIFADSSNNPKASIQYVVADNELNINSDDIISLTTASQINFSAGSAHFAGSTALRDNNALVGSAGQVLTCGSGGQVLWGSASGGLPSGTCYSDYLYWDGANWTPGSSTIHIGCDSGFTGQGDIAIAIGLNAGRSNQQSEGIAIGKVAGEISQGFQSIAIGSSAAQNSQGQQAIAIGGAAGQQNQASNSISIGYLAGQYSQNLFGLAIGYQAGQISQGENSIAIGYTAGQTNQGIQALAIGNGAGGQSQGQGSIAIGNQAGAEGIGALNCVAIGNNAGFSGQEQSAVAIGYFAGKQSQGNTAVAIGPAAGQTLQGSAAVAIGSNSGSYSQGFYSVAIGLNAGENSQGVRSVAIGYNTGQYSQGQDSVAVGVNSGLTYQGVNSVAIGNVAGQTNQGVLAVAIGNGAGGQSQGQGSIAIGNQAGAVGIGALNCVAIGNNAGYGSQGNNAVAIGAYAGQTSQSASTIVINATGTYLNTRAQSATYIAPIRPSTTQSTLYYDPNTAEITYGTASSGGGYWTLSGSNLYNSAGLQVGISTIAPQATLDVAGSALSRQIVTSTITANPANWADYYGKYIMINSSYVTGSFPTLTPPSSAPEGSILIINNQNLANSITVASTTSGTALPGTTTSFIFTSYTDNLNTPWVSL